MNVIELGDGLYGISRGETGGAPCILFRPLLKQHPVGFAVPSDKVGEEPYNHNPQDGDTMIVIKNLESARVLQDILNTVTLSLSGFKITHDADK